MDNDQQILDALYLGATDPKSFEQAIELLSARFHCMSGILLSVDPHVPETNLVLSTGVFDEAASQRYTAQFAAIDPAPAAFARLPVGTASTTDRLMSSQQFRSEFIHDFYYPLGLRETLAANLISSDGRFGLLGMHRGKDRAPFSDTEIAALEQIVPHLNRALQLRRSFMRTEARAAGSQDILDRGTVGVALMETAKSAVFVNRALRAIAGRGDGMTLDRLGKPVPVNSDARRRLDILIADAISGGPGGIVSIPRLDDGRPYAVLVSAAPSSIGNQVWDRRGQAVAIVLVHDLDAAAARPSWVLRQIFGLSDAETLVAERVMMGDLPTQASAALGIKISTVRWHLASLFRKTDTRRQAELVRLLLSLPDF